MEGLSARAECEFRILGLAKQEPGKCLGQRYHESRHSERNHHVAVRSCAKLVRIAAGEHALLGGQGPRQG